MKPRILPETHAICQGQCISASDMQKCAASVSFRAYSIGCTDLFTRELLLLAPSLCPMDRQATYTHCRSNQPGMYSLERCRGKPHQEGVDYA